MDITACAHMYILCWVERDASRRVEKNSMSHTMNHQAHGGEGTGPSQRAIHYVPSSLSPPVSVPPLPTRWRASGRSTPQSGRVGGRQSRRRGRVPRAPPQPPSGGPRARRAPAPARLHGKRGACGGRGNAAKWGGSGAGQGGWHRLRWRCSGAQSRRPRWAERRKPRPMPLVPRQGRRQGRRAPLWPHRRQQPLAPTARGVQASQTGSRQWRPAGRAAR